MITVIFHFPKLVMDITEIQKILRDYYKEIYTNKMDNLERTDKFLGRHNLLRLCVCVCVCVCVCLCVCVCVCVYVCVIHSVMSLSL